MVNSTAYGGSGGSVGTYSLASGATETALHEMGHKVTFQQFQGPAR